MELSERVACGETQIANLEGWQKKQNGCLLRLEEKINKIYNWLIGLMGGVVVSLILLIVQLITKT